MAVEPLMNERKYKVKPVRDKRTHVQHGKLVSTVLIKKSDHSARPRTRRLNIIN
jgi:hypothetical protein